MAEILASENLSYTVSVYSKYSHIVLPQLVRLLEAMGLDQYSETFRQQQINGDLLSDCDDELLRNELTISSRLHRMRLLRIISGQYSVMDLMAGRDGYVMMLAAPK